MPRIRFTTAYDGRPYLGWQSQPGGRTVQDALERAFSALFGSAVRIHGSGRTDAGVHALGQVFHVDAPDTHRIPADKWLRFALYCVTKNTVEMYYSKRLLSQM